MVIGGIIPPKHFRGLPEASRACSENVLRTPQGVVGNTTTEIFIFRLAREGSLKCLPERGACQTA